MTFQTALLAISVTGAFLYVRTMGVKQTREFFSRIGMNMAKVRRTAMEIERKTFHLVGLAVPLVYQHAMRHHGCTQREFATFAWCCTALTWIGDVCRLMFPSIMNHFPYSLLNRVMREKERTQLSGTCYFGLGCTLSMTLFPPAVAVLSIIWLVLGDMMAALIGVSFGGEAVVVKMGREGKKSFEGSLAMFVVCVGTGLWSFVGIYLAEYVVLVGALVATLVEAWEPFMLNDNITIPIFSGAAMQWALGRIAKC